MRFSDNLKDLTVYINRGITPKYTDISTCIVINQKCIREIYIDLKQARRHDIKNKVVSKDKRLRKHDIVVNSTGVGTLGRLSIIRKELDNLTCDSHVTIVRPDITKINPRYLGYYLFWKKDVIEGMARGSTGQTELSRIDLGNILIEYPEDFQQQKIANILSSLDEKIELNNKINKNLDELAQTLYKRWFVDFEFPNEDGEPYKSSGGEMVESEIGLIPKGWIIENVTNLFVFKGGSQPPKEEHIYEHREGYVRFIQNRDYKEETKHLTFIKESPRNKTAEKLDILMDKYGEVGQIRYGIEGAYNVALAKIEPINSKNLELLRGYFSQDSIREYLSNSSIASTRGSLNATTFTGLKIAYTESEIKEAYSGFQTNILLKILKNKEENKRLSQIRDELLPKLMNGEIEVPIEE